MHEKRKNPNGITNREKLTAECGLNQIGISPNKTNKSPRPYFVIQSILIKLAVFSIGVALILWFGWSVPQANQLRSTSSQANDVSQEVEKPILPLSLDINKGTKEEFQALPGIGPVLASRIIDHRESRGFFDHIEDLKAIDGIGEMKLGQLRPYITVNRPAKNES